MSHKELIHYFENVLGIKSILVDATPDGIDNNNIKIKKIKFLFCIEDLHLFSIEENELQNKMIQAMKLPEDNYKIINTSDEFAGDFEHKIMFKLNPQNINETYSAKRLLREPALKKETWEFLKKYI